MFEKLDKIPGDWRMRLSSIEAAEVNDDFIKAAANCEHLCPQFHPALQSGSDTVLQRMRRRYRVHRFLEKLERVREGLSEPAFTTDVIVGFPGETEEEFQETLDTCREARFMKIHVFPFSAREGTPAASFPDQLPPEVIKQRVARLMNLERELANEFYASKLGHDLEVLVEREADRLGYVKGTDRWYIPVECPGTEQDIGEFVTVRGSDVQTQHLNAERCEVASVTG